MPIYDYQCSKCGPFRTLRPMAERAAPIACPACGSASAKVITAPFLADMAPNKRIANQRNEQSMHAPRVMSRADLDLHDSHPHHHEEVQRPKAGLLGPGQWIRSHHRNMIGH